MGIQGESKRSHHVWTLISLFALITVIFIESSQAIMGGEVVDGVFLPALL